MAGVDITNQFPNSKMGQAVRLGQSRFVSVDGPSAVIGAQSNVDVSAAAPLVITDGATSALVYADGGPLYFTFDGTDPSVAHYAAMIVDGADFTLLGSSMASARVFGTKMSVTYYK